MKQSMDHPALGSVMRTISMFPDVYTEEAFETFKQDMFRLQASGIGRQELIDTLLYLLLRDDLSIVQYNILDDFVNRSNGRCTPGDEIIWPDADRTME